MMISAGEQHREHPVHQRVGHHGAHLRQVLRRSEHGALLERGGEPGRLGEETQFGIRGEDLLVAQR